MDIASTLKISFSKFVGNYGVRGGAIFFSRSTRGHFKKTFLLKNNADESGGGISIEDNYDSNFDFVDCIFSFNTANIYGGGLSFIRAMASLTSCTFNNNSAALGGAIAMTGRTRKQNVILEISKTRFLGNIQMN